MSGITCRLVVVGEVPDEDLSEFALSSPPPPGKKQRKRGVA
jgi:hypothetical protein